MFPDYLSVSIYYSIYYPNDYLFVSKTNPSENFNQDIIKIVKKKKKKLVVLIICDFS